MYITCIHITPEAFESQVGLTGSIMSVFSARNMTILHKKQYPSQKKVPWYRLHLCKAFAFQFVLSVFRTPLIIRKAIRLTLSFFFRVGGKKRWKTLWRDCRTEALQQDLRWLQAQQGVSMRRKLNFNTLHDFREEINRSGQVVRLERLGYLFFQLWRGPPEPQPLHCCPGGPPSLSRVFASEATSVLRQRNVF